MKNSSVEILPYIVMDSNRKSCIKDTSVWTKLTTIFFATKNEKLKGKLTKVYLIDVYFLVFQIFIIETYELPVRGNHLRCYLFIFDWRVDSVVDGSSRYVIPYHICYGDYSTDLVYLGTSALQFHQNLCCSRKVCSSSQICPEWIYFGTSRTWGGRNSCGYESNGYKRLTKHIWDITPSLFTCTPAKNELEIRWLEHQSLMIALSLPHLLVITKERKMSSMKCLIWINTAWISKQDI